MAQQLFTKAYRSTRNGELLAAATVALILSLAGAPAEAMSLTPCSTNPLAGGRTVFVTFYVGGSPGNDDEPAIELFGGDHGREIALTSRLHALSKLQLEAAGYAVETNEELWSTTDRARYEGTGLPHYYLFVSVGGKAFQPPRYAEDVYAFVVESTFTAEFLTPDYESFETYSDQRLGMSTEADLESEIAALFSTMIEHALAPDYDFCQPEIETTLSSGGRFSVDVIPPGAADVLGYLRRTLGDSPTVASLYSEPRPEPSEPFVSFALAREYPQRALISDDGRFVAMIYGLSTSGELVDIYRADGSLVRSLDLADLLSENDRETLGSLPSPGWWRGDHAIDERAGALILSIPACGVVEDCARPWAEVAVNLATGQLLRPKRDLIYRREPRVRPARLKYRAAEDPPIFVCRPEHSQEDFGNARRLAADDLLAGAELPMPAFTEIGRKARIEGLVELELLVSETGEVECVAVTKGLPMGLSDAARDMALTWRFPAAPLAAGSARTRLALRFELVVVPRSSSSSCR